MRATATFKATEIVVRDGDREATFPITKEAEIVALCPSGLVFRREGEVTRFPEAGILDKLEGK